MPLVRTKLDHPCIQPLVASQRLRTRPRGYHFSEWYPGTSGKRVCPRRMIDESIRCSGCWKELDKYARA
jgi:hypothetical protein